MPSKRDQRKTKRELLGELAEMRRRVGELEASSGGRQEDDGGEPTSELSYRQMVMEAADAIVATDRDSTILVWNRGAERIFGHPASEVLGRHSGFLVPESEMARARATKRKVLSGETVSDEAVVRVRKDGTLIEGLSNYTPLRDPSGRILGICSVFKDISARLRTEEELRSLREFSDHVVDSIWNGLVVLDPECRIMFWNTGIRRISGYSADQVLGKNFLELFPNWADRGMEDLFRAALEGRPSSLNNISHQTPKGQTVHKDLRVLPLHNQAGKVVGVMVIVRDVTEVALLEQRVEDLQEEIVQRKVIEAAKGILMRELDMSEDDSYSLIRRKSQEARKRMLDIAQQVIGLFGSPEEKMKFG